ncbi:MAG: protein kinase [Chloroflexi bacterium]|nr:protein kinase [Chloroflexota bacterium]
MSASQTSPHLGKYEIRGEIGEGRFGVVYRAWDPTLSRDVALKVLKPVLLTDPQFTQAFLGEAKTIAGLGNHPNIVTIYEVGQEQGKLFIAMEYLPHSLADILAEKKQLPCDEAVRVVSQVAEGLAAAHAIGLLHNDIKPSNILISGDGRAKLADFGLAKAVRASSTMSMSGAFSGTVEYAAPERAQNKPADARSDIYSLGVVAYEALTGSTPFQGNDPMAILYKHVNELPPPMSQSGAKVPPSVETAVLKALEKKPADRYASAEMFAAALRASVTPNAKQVPIKRSKPGLACTAVALVALVLVAGCLAVFAAIPGISQKLVALLLPQSTPTATQIATATATAALTLTGIPTAIPTSALINSLASSPTAAPSAIPTIAPTAMPLATAVPPTAAPTLAPTPMKSPVPTQQPTVPISDKNIGQAYAISTIAGSKAPAGQGSIQVTLRQGTGQVLQGVGVSIYAQKQDIQGRWVKANDAGWASTDNAGTATLNINPGQYIVAVDLAGYNWGDAADVKGKTGVSVASGQTTQVVVSIGRLTYGFVRADGTTIVNQGVTVYMQQQDVAGHWVSSGQVAWRQTDNTGAVSFDLAPGMYLVTSDLAGYSWGNAYGAEGEDSIPVQPGQETKRIITLGRITLALKKPDGSANTDQWCDISTQKLDVNGKPTKGSGVANLHTDNTGRAVIDLTPGKYAIGIGDQLYTDIEVVAGKITVFDGSTSRVQ